MGTYTPAPNWESQLPIEGWVRRATTAVEAEAIRLCPWRTGNLRRSIASEVIGSGASCYGVIWASAYYAIFVELGTRFMAAIPFLRPALAKVMGSM